ncbi:Ceramide synthase 5 [Nymphon striatum]|nr:Ceramide synthase 5 [Nymphon striatum]
MEEWLEAYEMWIYRRIGKVSWTERKTNEYVLRMLGIKKQLLNIVKERKLKYYGHIKRHQTVQRTTLEGKVEGKRSRGKQRLKWEDNIKGWTKRSMEECGRLAKDRVATELSNCDQKVTLFFLARIGRYYGLKDGKKKIAVFNAVLEKAFKANGRVTYKQIQGLSKQLDWTERQVERWLRHRMLQDKPSTLNKFTESGWRCTYYALIFIYEVWAFWDDFFAMFFHHWTTILLLSFSWSINLTRIGTLVLIVHDVADIFVEAAKMARYIDKEKLCNTLFAIFTIVWIISRLGVYPYVILYASLIEGGEIVFEGRDYNYPAYWLFNALLCTLQCLHIVWTFFIMRVLISALSVGKVVKDQRSDSSDNEAKNSVKNK